MRVLKLFNVKACLGIFAFGIGVMAAQPSYAQSAACVNLLVGAGYAAWMGVKLGDSTYWSSSFPIGQHRCVQLPVKGMVNGAPYSVVVKAVLGESKTCTPAPSAYSSSNTNSVVYNAWGTTQSVKCEMPSNSAAVAEATVATPSPAGVIALEAWKKEGPKPAPQ